MDTERIIVLIVGISFAGAFMIHMILGAIVRLRALQQQPLIPSIEARLERIETAVDAIASEIGRSGGVPRVAERLRPRDRIAGGLEMPPPHNTPH